MKRVDVSPDPRLMNPVDVRPGKMPRNRANPRLSNYVLDGGAKGESVIRRLTTKLIRWYQYQRLPRDAKDQLDALERQTAMLRQLYRDKYGHDFTEDA